MPTNKKLRAKSRNKPAAVRHTSAATVAAADAASRTSNPSSTSSSPRPWGLSQPQLVLLILLSLGISRLLQIKSVHVAAISTPPQQQQDDNNNNNEHPKNYCIQYLGEAAACADAAVQDALLYKFHTGLQTIALLMAVTLQCWKPQQQQQNEKPVLLLERLTSVLAFCPLLLWMGLGVLVFFSISPPFMAKKAVLKELLMGTVLLALTVPSERRKLPFWPDPTTTHVLHKRTTNKSLQSLCCLTLAFLNALQAGRWIWRGCSGGLFVNVQDHWTHRVASHVLLATPQHLAVGPILALVCVDFLTNAALHAFVWYYFTQEHRRSYLLSVATLQMVEYIHQVPILETLLRNSESMGTLSLSIGVVCAFCWIVPNLAWKKKLS